jgi:hypothetical protein
MKTLTLSEKDVFESLSDGKYRCKYEEVKSEVDGKSSTLKGTVKGTDRVANFTIDQLFQGGAILTCYEDDKTLEVAQIVQPSGFVIR